MSSSGNNSDVEDDNDNTITNTSSLGTSTGGLDHHTLGNIGGLATLSNVCYSLGSVASMAALDNAALDAELVILQNTIDRFEKEQKLTLLRAKAASYLSSTTSSSNVSSIVPIVPVVKSVTKTYETEDGRIITTADFKGNFMLTIANERPLAVTLDPRRFSKTFLSGNTGIDVEHIMTEIINSSHEVLSKPDDATAFSTQCRSGVGVNATNSWISTMFYEDIKDFAVIKDPVIFKRLLLWDYKYGNLFHFSLSHFHTGAPDLLRDLQNMDRATLEKRLEDKDKLQSVVFGPRWSGASQDFIVRFSSGDFRTSNPVFIWYKYEEVCCKVSRFVRDPSNKPLSDVLVICKYQELLKDIVIGIEGYTDFKERILPTITKRSLELAAPIAPTRSIDIVAGDNKRKTDQQRKDAAAAKKAKREASGSTTVPPPVKVLPHPCLTNLIKSSNLFATAVECSRPNCHFSHEPILQVKKKAALASINKAKWPAELTATDKDTMIQHIEANCPI